MLQSSVTGVTERMIMAMVPIDCSGRPKEPETDPASVAKPKAKAVAKVPGKPGRPSKAKAPAAVATSSSGTSSSDVTGEHESEEEIEETAASVAAHSVAGGVEAMKAVLDL